MAEWEVVGGKATGGIVVRFGMDKDSPQTKERLSCGAIIKEKKLQGERLQYTLVKGTGPETGWVSIKFKGNDMVVRTEKVEEIDAASPCVKAGKLEFPKPFFFGVATAALQIEGASKEGGRGPSIWDTFCEQEGAIEAEANAEHACDHYHRWKDDIDLMKKMGIQAYRFSISWPRLIPDGDGAVNEDGRKFYSDLIDYCLKVNITPWVTLYHWDLPQTLQDSFDGWTGPKEKMTAAFGHYARTCFKLFGDRVKNWFTLNEPWCCCQLGYGKEPKFAPGKIEAENEEDKLQYIAAHRMLLAHAEAVDIYRKEFKEAQKGQVGIVLNVNFKYPKNSSVSEDVSAASRGMDFCLGWFAHPIWLGVGNYPQSMLERAQGRIPEFTAAERKKIRGSADFFGINSYSTELAEQMSKKFGVTKVKGHGLTGDSGVLTDEDPEWESTDCDWAIVPWGYRDLLLHIHKVYKPPGGIVITECGCAHEDQEKLKLDEEEGTLVPKPYGGPGSVEEDFDKETWPDAPRLKYFKHHLAAVHAAMSAGVEINGFFAWSFMDNFEWADGYGKRFGMVRVDYPTQKRTIKESGRWYSKVIADQGFEAPPKSEQYKGKVW